MKIDTEKLLDEADVLISAFMYAQAMAKYNYILEHVSDCDEALLMRGALRGELGQIDAAIIDLEESIRLNNTNDSAYATLAYLYQRKNDNEKALELCRSAIALNSSNNEAIKLLIQICNKLGSDVLSKSQYDQAEPYFRAILAHRNSDTVVLYKLVLVLRGQGKIEKSIELAEKILAIEPTHIRAKAHIAASCELLGEIEKGTPMIESLLHDHPDHPMVSIVYAHYALRNNRQADGIAALTNMLRGQNIQEYDSVTALMFLGKLYDSIKDYDTAFKYYQQANELLDKNYDPYTHTSYTSNLIRYFSREKYAAMPESKNTSDELIFIVGMPRSGTSLIEQIIATHNSVFGAGELTLVNTMVSNIQAETESAYVYPACLDEVDANTMNKMADKLIADMRAINADSLKISDKLPHNFLHIGLIHKLLPNAKIIHCVRDARDTCLSCYFQYFAGYHPYANNLHSLAMHYLDYERLMNHWTNELNIPMLTVSYENVVSDTRSEIKRIIDYLGLPWQEECVDFHKNKRTVATSSYNQVNKNIYSGSVGRWKNYESNLTPLILALKK